MTFSWHLACSHQCATRWFGGRMIGSAYWAPLSERRIHNSLTLWWLKCRYMTHATSANYAKYYYNIEHNYVSHSTISSKNLVPHPTLEREHECHTWFAIPSSMPNPASIHQLKHELLHWWYCKFVSHCRTSFLQTWNNLRLPFHYAKQSKWAAKLFLYSFVAIQTQTKL